jgi:hypothetical protein
MPRIFDKKCGGPTPAAMRIHFVVDFIEASSAAGSGVEPQRLPFSKWARFAETL